MSNSAALDFILKLTDKVSKPLQSVTKGFDAMAKSAKDNTVMMGAGLAAIMGGVIGIKGTLAEAKKMNDALKNVEGFGATENALKRLNNTALDFAARYGKSAIDFVGHAGTIQQKIEGLTDSQLVTFSNASNLLAVATKTDGANISAYMSTVYNGYSDYIDKIGKSTWAQSFASQSAAATKMFKVGGDDLNAYFQKMGATAGRAQLDLTEQLAIAGTLGGSMDGSRAGAGMQAILNSTSSASAKLGLKFTDANKNLLPMVDIVDKLNAKFGDLTNQASLKRLQDAFGGEGSQAIMTLMKNTDKLKGSIASLGKIHGLEHVQRIAEQSVDPWERFSGQVQALRIGLGQALLPVLTPVFEKFTSIGQTLQRWTVLFPNLTKLIGLMTVGIMAHTMAMGALMLVTGLLKNAWLVLTVAGKALVLVWKLMRSQLLWQIAKITLLTTWYTAVAVAQGLWSAATWVLNAALYANPIVWIIAGIAALVAGVVLAIYYWDEWTGFLVGVFSAGIETVMGWLEGISDWFGSVGGWIGVLKTAWSAILNIFYKAIDKVISYLNYIPGVNIDLKFSGDDLDKDLGLLDQKGATVQQASDLVKQAKNQVTPAAKGGMMAELRSGQGMGSLAGQGGGKTVNIENFTIQNDKALDQSELENMMMLAGG